MQLICDRNIGKRKSIKRCKEKSISCSEAKCWLSFSQAKTCSFCSADFFSFPTVATSLPLYNLITADIHNCEQFYSERQFLTS